jgi:hypothetical protein
MIKVLYEVKIPIEELIINFLKDKEIKSDDDVHKFSEDNKLDPHDVELEIYKMAQAFWRGGRSYDNKTTEDDKRIEPKELKDGLTIEYEHCNKKSSYAPYISGKIRLDHISESIELDNPLYYDFLVNMEKWMKRGITTDQINKLLKENK